jgi:tetratricopeptide (TPR) repeat protein
MTPCPTDDTLGAMLQHALDRDETERVGSHLDQCVACQQIVIAAVRGGLATPPPTAIGTPSLSPLVAGEPGRSEIGSRIGRYEVRTLLGAGGMGHVYEAYDAELDRAIALKVLRPELAGVAAVLAERLLRESRIMAKVVHPSVITVHDVGREGDAVFIAMELHRGETLGAYVARARPPWREIVSLFERAGDGLAAAHDAGVVHRDFKPDNVLIELEGTRVKRVVVTDFGIARVTASLDDLTPTPGSSPRNVRLTATGSAIGTPAYMAPEQLAGKLVDKRADVFAFSVSLWEALFGQRPFPGNTVDEIRARMKQGPVALHGDVPRRLVRVVERGLAIDPDERWPDMRSMWAALRPIRARRRRSAIAAGAAGLVGIGVAGALLLARHAPDDRCAPGLDAISRTYDPGRSVIVRAALARDPGTSTAVLAKLDAMAAAWRTTHIATCHVDREPAQPPTTTACLDARRLELDAYIDDVITDGPRYARTLGGILGEPVRCATPAPGLLSARVPEDRALRRKVTAIRYRAFDAEDARDRADFTGALASAVTIVADAAPVWPPLHAEALYLLGTIQSQGGNNQVAVKALREAAAVADAAHADYIAANVWLQLATSVTFDNGDPVHGLEYVGYAEAANNRLGRPGDVTTMVEYVKGATLVEADRSAEGEVALRHAVELAEANTPELIPQAIQGLGYLYEDQGRTVEAVEAYREALARLPKTGPGVPSAAVIFRGRLAQNLSLLGKSTEAEAVAREGAEIADRTLGRDNLDRVVAHVNLAQVLEESGQLDKALVEIQGARRDIARLQSDRSERYGEVLGLEASILVDLDRVTEAETLFARACDVIAFQAGDGSSQEAECWMNESEALFRIGRSAEVVALMDKALPALVKTYGEDHPQVANALVTRGAAHHRLGHHVAATADLEKSIAMFAKVPIEGGHLAGAEWALAKELWRRDPTRAHALIETALKRFDTASVTWSRTRADAAEWLATDGNPKHPQ